LAAIAEHSKGGSTWRAAVQDARLWLLLLTAVLTLVDGYLIFVVAPTDGYQGHIQRVFYIHVPISILSFLGFLLCAVAGVGYLMRRGEAWDRLAHASAEVGVIFVTLALLTGIIWGKATWNAWWQWDARLTTTLILWFIYVAYLMIRHYAPTLQQGRAWSAVVGIIGFVDVPIVYFSVKWWRTLHPPQVIGPVASEGSVEPVMARILMFSMLAMLALFTYLLLERMALRGSEDALAQIRREGTSD
jgi:heme exporter protein C